MIWWFRWRFYLFWFCGLVLVCLLFKFSLRWIVVVDFGCFVVCIDVFECLGLLGFIVFVCCLFVLALAGFDCLCCISCKLVEFGPACCSGFRFGFGLLIWVWLVFGVGVRRRFVDFPACFDFGFGFVFLDVCGLNVVILGFPVCGLWCIVVYVLMFCLYCVLVVVLNYLLGVWVGLLLAYLTWLLLFLILVLGVAWYFGCLCLR